MEYLFFIVNNTLAFAVGAIFTDFFFNRRPLHIRFLTWVACFPVVTLFVTLSLLTAGILTVENAAIFTAVLLGIVLCVKNASAKKTLLPSSLQPESKHFYIWIIILTAGFLAGGIVLGLVMPGTDFRYDDLSYHATFAAHCISEQTLNIVPLDYHAYFPLNAETFSLWFMLPFHADAFAGLTGVLWMGLVVLSGLSICSTLKCPKYAILLICILLFSSQVCKSWMRTFNSVDIASTAMILSAIAIAVDHCSSNRSVEKFGRLLFSGLFAGYALGCKISFAPICAILCIWWLVWGRSEISLSSRLRWVSVFIAGVFMTGAFWYIRNIVLTGSPFFPAQLGPFGGPLDAESANRTKLISWILQSPLDVEQWKFLIAGYSAWPVMVFAASLAGCFGCLRALSFSRKKIDKQTLTIYSLLIAAGITFLLFYPFIPFSGTTNSSNAPLNVDIRYLIFPWAIGIIGYSSLLSCCIKKKIAWYVFGVSCVVLPVRVYMPGNTLINIAVLAAGLLTTWIGGQLFSKLGPPQITLFSAIVFFAATMIGLMPGYQRQQHLTDRNLYYAGSGRTLDSFKGPLGVYRFGIGRLDSIPDGSVITSFGLGPRYYGLFGRDYQYVPKTVDAEGVGYVPLHLRWKNDPENTKWWAKTSIENVDKLVENLKQSGVEYVFVHRKRREWPIQNTILSESQHANKIHGDDQVIIWELR